MKAILTIVVFSCLMFTPASAVVTYTFREDGDDVVATYSGSLQTSLLSFQGALTYSRRYVDILGIVQAGQMIIEFENAQPLAVGQHPSYLGTSFRYSANNITYDMDMDFAVRRYLAPNSTGDTFGFYVFEQSGQFVTWINVPYQYVSGTPIDGEMRFEGETLLSMGLEESETFTIFLPGGESIVGEVVPEPNTMILAGLAAGLSAIRRRRPRAPV
jgi:hypothetical protein